MIKTIVLISSIFLSVQLIAQSSNRDQTNKTTLPINATKKTDPNYKENLAKSKLYKPYIKKEQVAPIKNEAYYQDLINDLKEDIAKREKTENQNDDVIIGKILWLKDELFLAEESLKKITTEN
jgi:hypothetical protein